ncbi:MAG TPA: hypothetical protein VFC38_10355 [Stellaceae bacterium]|nr:hypothetical protein [Stellaceae bacterium]
MPRPTEIRQAAELMIRRHGTYAAVKAGFRAGCLMEDGEPVAAAIWVRIINEINALRVETRAENARPLEPRETAADAPEANHRVA